MNIVFRSAQYIKDMRYSFLDYLFHAPQIDRMESMMIRQQWKSQMCLKGKHFIESSTYPNCSACGKHYDSKKKRWID